MPLPPPVPCSRGGGGYRLPGGHANYLSTAPTPGPLPFGANIYTPPGLYTPQGGTRAPRPQARFPRGKAPGGLAQVGAGGGGGRGAGGGRGGGRGLPPPPGPPSAQAVTDRRGYNAMVRVQQEAPPVSPQGHSCQDCVAASRNPHHFCRNCAYAECRHCKRGGHCAGRCPFAAYP